MSNPEMKNGLDNELKKVFERQEPPLGFANRVMARIPAAAVSHSGNPASYRGRTRVAPRWLAAAAAACIAVIGTGAWEQHRRQVEGEQAKRELMYALTVASESLQTTKHLLTR